MNKLNKLFNVAYCLGASVVIIGAMGKITHRPWSDLVLQIGLITEAVLFVLQGIQEWYIKPETTPEVAMFKMKNQKEVNVDELESNINSFNENVKKANSKFVAMLKGMEQ